MNEAARLYGVPITDYERPSRGILISSGCGIMMSVMDQCPSIRWCVDIDRMKSHGSLADFFTLASTLADRIAVCGWFSITDPAPLRVAVASAKDVLVYARPEPLGAGDEVRTLYEFLERLNT